MWRAVQRGENILFFFLQNRSYTTETENRSLYKRVLCTLASGIYAFLTNVKAKSEESELLNVNLKSDQLAINMILPYRLY